MSGRSATRAFVTSPTMRLNSTSYCTCEIPGHSVRYQNPHYTSHYNNNLSMYGKDEEHHLIVMWAHYLSRSYR